MLGGLSVREKMFLAPDTITFQIIIDRQTISSPTHSNTASIQSSPAGDREPSGEYRESSQDDNYQEDPGQDARPVNILIKINVIDKDFSI